jgi:hypothetical protein
MPPSILKKVTAIASVTNLTSPIIDSVLLTGQSETSAATFCDRVLQSIYTKQQQQLLENGEPFPTLTLETSQEILFYSLLRWSHYAGLSNFCTPLPLIKRPLIRHFPELLIQTFIIL